MSDTMPLADLIDNFTTGDGDDWGYEVAWIKTYHPRRLARITKEIRRGHFPPIRLCYAEKRVIDGAHRVVAAIDLHLEEVPVADAWDPESDWADYADNRGIDDPEGT